MEGRLIAALASEDVECFSNFLGYFEQPSDLKEAKALRPRARLNLPGAS